MERKPYVHNDEYLDLGHIGQHEIHITSLNIAQPHELPRMVIKRAIVMIHFQGYPVQTLDVTGPIREDPGWLWRVTAGYKRMLNIELETPA